MGVALRVGTVAGLGLALAGCSVSGLAPIGPVATPPVASAPPPPAYGAFLDGPVGRRLSEADRDKARDAEQAAIASGQRRTWRGENGVYGYVEPAGGPVAVSPPDAVPASAEACRDFTSTIYLGGRPQVGHGRGCMGADGSSRIVS